jgi:hypothetical protein
MKTPGLRMSVFFALAAAALQSIVYFTWYTKRYAFDEMSGNSVEVTYYLLHTTYAAKPIDDITFADFDRSHRKLLWKNHEETLRVVWGTTSTFYTQGAADRASRLASIRRLIRLYKECFKADFKQKCKGIGSMSTEQANLEIRSLSSKVVE